MTETRGQRTEWFDASHSVYIWLIFWHLIYTLVFILGHLHTEGFPLHVHIRFFCGL